MKTLKKHKIKKHKFIIEAIDYIIGASVVLFLYTTLVWTIPQMFGIQ